MKKLIEKIKREPSKALLLMVFIYPILPLGLFAGVFVTMGFIESVSNVKALTLNHLWFSLFLTILFLGGPVGIYAVFRVLLNKFSKLTFWLFIYGSISYAFIAVTYISASLGQFDLMLLHAAYLVISLVVILYQLFKLYGNVFELEVKKESLK